MVRLREKIYSIRKEAIHGGLPVAWAPNYQASKSGVLRENGFLPLLHLT